MAPSGEESMTQHEPSRNRARAFASVFVMVSASIVLPTDSACADGLSQKLTDERADAVTSSRGDNLRTELGNSDLGAGRVKADFLPTDADPELRYSGAPFPGSRITVGLSGTVERGTTYRWTQIDGPKADLDDPTKPRVQLTVPYGARKLSFVLTIRDGHGERNVRVTIPIESPQDSSIPRANAGDDQIGLAGRRITLNGSGSTPSDQIKCYRWVQIGGPKITDSVQEKQYFSFIPSAPGVYRLLLLVDSNDIISLPDEVAVAVGELPASFGLVAKPNVVGPVEHSVPGGAGSQAKLLQEQVADVFEAIAARTSLYSSFGELTSEMMRQLDVIVPKDPQSRQLWTQGIFVPLSQRLATEMAMVGLDLRLPGAHQQKLSEFQKDKLQGVFQIFAQEFRTKS
jgi:hypothetical protein